MLRTTKIRIPKQCGHGVNPIRAVLWVSMGYREGFQRVEFCSGTYTGSVLSRQRSSAALRSNLAPLNRIVIAMPERQITPFIALGFCSNYSLLGFS